MTTILLLLGLLIIASCMQGTARTFHADYAAPARMRYWKGILVLLILMSHYTGYISTDPADETYLLFRQLSGQSIVMLFFFCSGFGMMKQAIRRRGQYLRSLPSRFARVWITCAVSVALMLLVQTLRGREYMPQTIWMAFACWASIGNSTWYIFVILVSYVLFAASILPLCLRASRATRVLAVLLLSGLTAAFVGWMQGMELEEYWYDTVFLLPLGAWWALGSRWIDRTLQRSDLGWTAALTVLAGAAAALFVRREESFLLHEGWLAALCATMVVLSMKVTPASRLLGFFGDHVLPVYLFQRIPMILLYESGLLADVPHLMFPVTVLACAAIALGYDRICAAISARLLGKQPSAATNG